MFASIQSLHKNAIAGLDLASFDVVIVDEFHHANADSCARLLHHLKPKLLLGLTATPERSDGTTITDWFDGHTAAELRLWDPAETGTSARSAGRPRCARIAIQAQWLFTTSSSFIRSTGLGITGKPAGARSGDDDDT